MRPFRLVYIIAFALSTLILLLSISRRHNHHAQHGHATTANGKPSALGAMFSMRSPLFPASAIISLTDDNSTFFLSRPAAFGAELPTDGLSGQLWIGSGFGEDLRGWVGSTNLPEGELGCSDVPGWDEMYAKFGSVTNVGAVKNTLDKPVESEDSLIKSVDISQEAQPEEKKKAKVQEIEPATKDDGTDNYLFQPGPSVDDASDLNSNADIQSLQESAEITGKVVLLSRGGCGFLDKAKWAQRRGGVALIVGDNMPGGPLVTMYARGDTSNISIPAIFTSHTTAHLLSSLIPLKNGGKALNAGTVETTRKGQKKEKTQKKVALKAAQAKSSDANMETVAKGVAKEKSSSKGFFRKVFSLFSRSNENSSHVLKSESKDDWVMVQDWQQDDSRASMQTKLKEQKQKDFVIGVQDWRDPGLSKPVDTPDTQTAKSTDGKSKQPTAHHDRPDNKADKESLTQSSVVDHAHMNGGNEAAKEATKDSATQLTPPQTESKGGSNTNSVDTAREQVSEVVHEGLWVTITPTSMSSSPFFDTILVLVISPLVTLSVVYAVLLIRSRIRRRRWRAPKSVVDRLPVRTYHTIPSSGASTNALATPAASSPNTPLLQSSADTRPALSRSHSRHRPRSRTTSEMPGPSTHVSDFDDDEYLSLTESAKREKSLATWRRRYGGRQKECVVCLEEYVSGVSRVMSLPCGHEFHVECITPWLTTRRRTCPICKGDVVRSMTIQDANDHLERATAAVLAANDDGLQARVASTRNDSPSAHEPVPMDESDVERAQHEEDDEDSSSGMQNLSDWIADWWERLRSNSWEMYDGRRAARGRRARSVHDPPDRDR